jgi:hypothetical protein
VHFKPSNAAAGTATVLLHVLLLLLQPQSVQQTSTPLEHTHNVQAKGASVLPIQLQHACNRLKLLQNTQQQHIRPQRLRCLNGCKISAGKQAKQERPTS